MRNYLRSVSKSSLFLLLSVSLLSSQLSFARCDNCLPKTAFALSAFGLILGGMVALGGIMFLPDLPKYNYHCDEESEYNSLLQIGEYKHCSGCDPESKVVPICVVYLCGEPQFSCRNSHNQTIAPQRNVDQTFLLTAIATGGGVVLGVIGAIGLCTVSNLLNRASGRIELLPSAA